MIIADALQIQSWNKTYAKASPEQILAFALETFRGDIAFASSFGLEDVVLQHLLLPSKDQVSVFVLDTGRLPEETYSLIALWRQLYGLRPFFYTPEPKALEAYLDTHGPSAMYDSVAFRQECCHIRKVEPLGRDLQGKAAWITGLRQQQSAARAELTVFSLDEVGRVKIAPLFAWQGDDVWDYIKKHKVSYNSLHDQNFPSIGCTPCTRAIKAGEDQRAGRWWWEQEGKQECGLHTQGDRYAKTRS